jgi:multicomponent Na+:H+ antiporter subunit D
MLTPLGLTASGEYLVEHGLLKASMFMAAGILLHRFGSVDEHELRGRASGGDRGLRAAGVVFAVGGLGLAALPPLGTFAGKSALEDAVGHVSGYGWVVAVLVVASMITAGAILRVTGRVFLGLGPRVPRHQQQLTALSEQPETLRPHDRTPAVMYVPATVLALGGLAIGLVGSLRHQVAVAATHLTERAVYAAHVLGGTVPAVRLRPPGLATKSSDYVFAAVSVLGALALAGIALGDRAPGAERSLGRAATAATVALRRLHSGCANDYVAWLVAGLAVVGGALALT